MSKSKTVVREVPPFMSGVFAIARLQWKRIIRGRKLWFAITAVVLVLMAVLIPLLFAASGEASLGPEGLEAKMPAIAPFPDAMDRTHRAGIIHNMGYNLGFFGLLIYLVPYLFNAGSIAEEVERRTFAFLAGRPTSRFAMLLGKFLSGAGASLLLILCGMLVMHLIAYAPAPSSMVSELPYTLRTMGGAAFLVLYYSAICTLWGTVAPEAAGIVAAVHLALAEFCVGFLPGVLRLPSMNYVASELAGCPPNDLLGLPYRLEWWVALIILGAVIALAIAISGLVISSREFRYGKAH